jgi:hypothetical protein
MPRHLLLPYPKSSIFLQPPPAAAVPRAPDVGASESTSGRFPRHATVTAGHHLRSTRHELFLTVLASVCLAAAGRGRGGDRHGSGEAERLQGCRAKSITAQTTARACRPPPQACTTRSRRASICRRIDKFRMLHAASGISFRLDSSCVSVCHELSAPPSIIQIFSTR